MPAHPLAFGEVGVAREDERVDACGTVGFQAGDDLVRIAHDGRPGAAASPADPRPEAIFHEALGIRRLPQLGLAQNAQGSGVQGAGANRGALAIIELADQSSGCCTGFAFAFARSSALTTELADAPALAGVAVARASTPPPRAACCTRR